MSGHVIAPRRRVLFRFAALLSPLALFAVLELLLRVVGYGGSYPLFVPYEDIPGTMHAGSEVINRYVLRSGKPIARIRSLLFREEKPADGCRIVVQGGSSAAGFPYGSWGGMAGMLYDRLEAALPEREIEVVNTAVAAVNSYTLLDLAEEIVAIEPDAVLIYAGHNEYLGVLGVGSALTPASSGPYARLHLKLRGVRVYQLAQRLVASVREANLGASGSDRATLFSMAASGAEIRLDSEAYRAGIRQLERNLDELLGIYARAGIPVYVGTLVSNLRDLEPFVGGPAEDVDADEWSRLWRTQRARRVEGRLDESRALIEQMLSMDPDAADTHFALAKLELAFDRPDAAAAAFLRAKEGDRLRFRAPEAFNRSIREIASRHGAKVVEVQERFQAASPDRIVGKSLVLEHVHPNVDGYFMLADSFYRALDGHGCVGRLPDVPSASEARANVPLTEVDVLLGDLHVRDLKAGFPFSDPPGEPKLPVPRTEPERLARALHDGQIKWIEAMERLSQLYQREGRLGDAARVARLAAHEYPADKGPNYAAGALMMQVGEHARARRYMERSLRAMPDDAETLAALSEIDRVLGVEPAP